MSMRIAIANMRLETDLRTTRNARGPCLLSLNVSR
jgi:hypothetical protein